MTHTGTVLRIAGSGDADAVRAVVTAAYEPLIPVIGITNWLLIPFAAVGAIIAAIGIALSRPANRGRAKTGLLLNVVVVVVATLRLGMFGGVL